MSGGLINLQRVTEPVGTQLSLVNKPEGAAESELAFATATSDRVGGVSNNDANPRHYRESI
jgi:hypothetical protein